MKRIDLDKLVPRTVIMPLVDGSGVYHSRRVKLSSVTGWYYVELGEDVRLVGEADIVDVLEEIERRYCDKLLKGYVFGDEIVPVSFNTAKTKFGLTSPSLKVHFLPNLGSWCCIEALVWEDKQLFFVSTVERYQDVMLDLRERFEKGADLDNLKGVTPEMRYFCLLYTSPSPRD